MAKNPKFADAFVNAECSGGLIAVFAGAKLRYYDGSQPATADDAIAGLNHLLAELTFGSPAFPAPSSGLLTANAITKDDDADLTGTASFFRVFKSDGVTSLMDGTIGITPGAFDLVVDTASIVQHADVLCDSFTIQVSKG